MEHTIIREKARNIRMLALYALKPVWLLCAGGVCLYTVINDVPSLVTDTTGFTISFQELQNWYTELITYGTISSIPTIPKSYWIYPIYWLLVTGPLTLGLSSFLMQIFRKQPARTLEVFLGFSDFGRSFLAHILMTLISAVLTCFFVIPGIIASIAMSMTYYVMADHPDYSAWKCIKTSVQLMKGNKWKFFLLQLSFIGWYILQGIVTNGFNAISSFLAVFISTIITAVLTAYVQLSDVVFYEMAVGNVHRSASSADLG